MSHWFDAQAAKTGQLSPEQRDKVRLIKEALGESDRDVHKYLIAIAGYERSLIRFGPDRKYPAGVSPVELEHFAKLRAELLRARDRLNALHTGLRAESELSDSLTAGAAAVKQWHRGMAATDTATIGHAHASMERHFATADRLGKAGLADLKKGR